MVFATDVDWKWEENNLPKLYKYTYLGIDFQFDGAWDSHIEMVVENGRNILIVSLVTGE